MNKLLQSITYSLTKIIKQIAFFSANSLSMIGMYEPDCPKELIK